MATEICPKCRQLRNVRVTMSSRKVKTPDGKTTLVTTTSAHCETCGSFIRSEDREHSAP